MRNQMGLVVGGVTLTPRKSVVENITGPNNLRTFAALLKAGGLVGKLSGTGPFTVFAPTDTAFEKLAPGTVSALVDLERKKQLVNFLGNHIVAGLWQISGSEVGDQVLTTVTGKNIKLIKRGTSLWANAAEIEAPDIISKNGVLHVIHSVLVL